MAGTPKVVAIAREFKAQLLAGEQAHQYEMARRYLEVEKGLQDKIAALASQLALKKAQGIEPTLGSVYRLERWQSLEQQMLAELASFNGWAVDAIKARQAELGQMGLSAAVQMLTAGAVAATFDHLPTDAVLAMVGKASDGSPLATLLAEAYPKTADTIANALVAGTALGKNPEVVAREMREAAGVGLDRAFLIARTEEIGAYRMASQAQYVAAGVETYHRMATLDEATCIGCLAADGLQCDSGEQFDDHPACRCTSIPDVPGAAQYVSDAQSWFDSRDRDVQLSMMGPGRFDAYESGTAQWSDLWTRTTDETWGSAIVPTPVSELTGGGMPTAEAA